NPDKLLRVIKKKQVEFVLKTLHEDPVSGHLGENITIEKAKA
ncbi:3474_t:CDS:1, partial [Ambispora leptoticha]